MFQSSWWEITTHIISLAIAYALALPVGWDRENDARSAGIRTFPLVAIASCGFVLVGIAILGRTSPAQARLLRSEEHTSELQSLIRISYAVFCLKKQIHRS